MAKPIPHLRAQECGCRTCPDCQALLAHDASIQIHNVARELGEALETGAVTRQDYAGAMRALGITTFNDARTLQWLATRSIACAAQEMLLQARAWNWSRATGAQR